MGKVIHVHEDVLGRVDNKMIMNNTYGDVQRRAADVAELVSKEGWYNVLGKEGVVLVVRYLKGEGSRTCISW